LKYVSRLTLLCVVIVLALAGLTGCTSGPKHEYPGGKPTMEDAKKLEATDPERAYDEYIDIKNAPGIDHEKAAEALLKGVLLASDDVACCRYGDKKPGDPDLSTDVRDQLTDRQAASEIKAHEALKELLKEYAGTKAAKQAVQSNLLAGLETRIDERNRHSTKKTAGIYLDRISYAIVDGLVAVTGRQRGFSYWFALVFIAVVVKAITLPLTLKMYKSQREMQRLQPAIKAMQEKYKEDQPELQKRTMAFYKEHGVNPFSSCFPMLIQFPFMIWIYDTIRLYEFHFSQGTFLWVNPSTSKMAPEYIAANLGQFDFILLVIYTASMYLTMKLTPATDPQAAQQQKSMSVMTTGMMFFFFIKYRWSAAFVLYWLVLNILSAAQSYYFVYKPNKNSPVVPLALPDDKPAKSNGANGTGGKSGGAKSPVLRPAVDAPQAAARPRRPRRPRK
jgi:YidC/Oxa1 family membrane protein insertase